MNQDRFNIFKAAVAALEFTEDTVELDRRLGKINTLLYDIRQEIDEEWSAARRKSKGAVRPPLTPAELEDILNIIRGTDT